MVVMVGDVNGLVELVPVWADPRPVPFEYAPTTAENRLLPVSVTFTPFVVRVADPFKAVAQISTRTVDPLLSAPPVSWLKVFAAAVSTTVDTEVLLPTATITKIVFPEEILPFPVVHVAKPELVLVQLRFELVTNAGLVAHNGIDRSNEIRKVFINWPDSCWCAQSSRWRTRNEHPWQCRLPVARR